MTARAADVAAPRDGAAAPHANGHARPADPAQAARVRERTCRAPAGRGRRDRTPAVDDATAPLELEDDDWLAPPPVRGGFGASATSAPAYAPPRGKPRKRLFSPVVLVGLYAAGGIGLVVLAVSLLSGMGGADRPDPRPAPAAATTTPAPTPEPTPPAAEGPSPAEIARFREAARDETRAAAGAAERAERAARAAERRRIARERRARARARARAEARRRAAAQAGSQAPATSVTPQATPTPQPSTGGGGGGPPDCEFCIG